MTQTKDEIIIKCKNKNVLDIPLLSFFTGGGFLDMGFEKAGFKVIWTNENNAIFADLYEKGYTTWRKSIKKKDAIISNRGDIESLQATTILTDAFLDNTPPIFGIIGGPPCPDFSAGGKHNGSEGEKGHLTETFINLICDLQPSFFVMENVAGLFKFKKHREFLFSIENKLNDYGFIVEHSVLNAIDFGVPQNRERIFVVGIARSIAEHLFDFEKVKSDNNWFPWPEVKKYKDALKKYEWPSMSNFGGSPPVPKGIPKNLFINSILVTKKDRDAVPNANNIFIAHSEMFKKVSEGDTTGKSFKRLHRYRYSPTACYGNNEVHLHPWEPRRISLREVMRIQSIPDTYILPEEGPLSHKFKLVSNGVPVLLAQYVANALKHVLIDIVNDNEG